MRDLPTIIARARVELPITAAEAGVLIAHAARIKASDRRMGNFFEALFVVGVVVLVASVIYGATRAA